MVLFDRTHPPLSVEDIKDVEGELGITIPDDLRDHYLRYNGGLPEPGFFPKDGDWYGVDRFLPMKAGDRNIGFEETYRDLVLSTPEFPRGFIPFAVDGAGDYFLYCVKNDGFGKIMFNQSDYLDDPQRFVIFLSDNLGSFIESLSSPD